MNVEYHDDLVLIQRNYVDELPSIAHIDEISISPPKDLVLLQREKAVTEKSYIMIYQFTLYRRWDIYGSSKSGTQLIRQQAM